MIKPRNIIVIAPRRTDLVDAAQIAGYVAKEYEFNQSHAFVPDFEERTSVRALLLTIEHPVRKPTHLYQAFRIMEEIQSAIDRHELKVIVLVKGDAGDLAEVINRTQVKFPTLSAAGRVGGAIIVQPEPSTALEAAALLGRQVSEEQGPAWVNVAIAGSVLSNLEKTLLQRSFADAQSIEVERLGNRKSVFRVRMRSQASASPVPFFAKIQGARAADQERANIRDWCEEFVPFYSLPPLVPARCAAMDNSRILVFHYADRAVPLATILKTRSPARPIAALFDGALRNWRSHEDIEKIDIGAYLFDTRVVPGDAERYQEAYSNARKIDASVSPPDALINRIRSFGKRDVARCISHGDLHADNVLVTEGAEETFLIDFYRTRIAPAVVDPAELESSLAFGCSSGMSPLTLDDIKTLYNHTPLSLAVRPTLSSTRAIGVEQIRRQIAGCVEPDVYRCILAASVLFYAAKRDTCAYLAASALVLGGMPPFGERGGHGSRELQPRQLARRNTFRPDRSYADIRELRSLRHKKRLTKPSMTGMSSLSSAAARRPTNGSSCAAHAGAEPFVV